ncbi:hypothetical protein [Alloprevotella tannerae]|nr:hypothetical protein [Alloprevotella tannerae]
MSQAPPDVNERRANSAARKVGAKPQKMHDQRVIIALKFIKNDGRSLES